MPPEGAGHKSEASVCTSSLLGLGVWEAKYLTSQEASGPYTSLSWRVQSLKFSGALVCPGSLGWGKVYNVAECLLSIQEAGGDRIDWGEDPAATTAATGITVLETGTEGKCPAALGSGEAGVQGHP